MPSGNGGQRCRVAQACTKALDELEVALDAMCAMRAQFFLRYEILSAVDRRVGGQGLVQYACVPNQPDRVRPPSPCAEPPNTHAGMCGFVLPAHLTRPALVVHHSTCLTFKCHHKCL